MPAASTYACGQHFMPAFFIILAVVGAVCVVFIGIELMEDFHRWRKRRRWDREF